MTRLPEPGVSLFINGIDVGSYFAPYLLSFEWTDNLHAKADEISAKLRDDTGLWRGPWRPEQGDVVDAEIGYQGEPFMRCGKFEVNTPEAFGRRASDILAFTAISTFPSKELRTQRDESHEETNLKEVVEKLASRHGYQVSGDIEPIPLDYKKQRRKRDLQFIKQLAEDYGYFVTDKDNTLIFYKRDDIQSQSPVAEYNIADGTTQTRWKAKDSTHEIFSEAHARYFHGEKKELIEGFAEDGDAKTNNKMMIDERVDTKEQAEKLAKGRLGKANENKRTASITIVGNPLRLAGQVITLGKTYGKYTGNYLIHVAKHKIRRAVYLTDLELKGV